MNDRDLIDYLLNLHGADQRKIVESALAQSPELRARLEALKARVAQLDALKESPAASETLISDTLRRIRNAPAPVKAKSDFRWFWVPVASLAAVAAAIFLLPRPDITLPPPVPPPLVKTDADEYEVTLAQPPEPLDEMPALPESRTEFALWPAASPPAEGESGVEWARVEKTAMPLHTEPPASATLAMKTIYMDRRTLGLEGRVSARPSASESSLSTTTDRLDSSTLWNNDGLVWTLDRKGRFQTVSASNTTDAGLLVQFGTNAPALVPPHGSLQFPQTD